MHNLWITLKKEARFMLRVHTCLLLTWRCPLKSMNMIQHHQYPTQQDKRHKKGRLNQKKLQSLVPISICLA
ncbi:hypothetical protein JHK82_047269 [Glycine max]|uniref:Uncharacterized protein n=1 Tax=Glycine max TaxID=3847 RepID=K7ML87_SOYBN|nr:hypothetical protein JHK86_047163 [Glycine max]KAG4932964.1 hypothetical protein JHK87_046966 [Glycine soja]KAG4943093.1 hypothetical protein JHK85_047739 [Glycine max]KAG5097415.1 hypothetical protein JHK82_047269 [Glycine max]KAG5102203.1 hypothetical protein JHK84_047172 [Glycine max]